MRGIDLRKFYFLIFRVDRDMCDTREKFRMSLMNCSKLCCTSLTAEEFAAILAEVTPKEIAKNDFFIKEGDVCSHIAFVRHGMLRHFYTSADEEITRWISLPGDFFIVMPSFITREPSVEYVQAIEETRLLCVSHTSWLKLCQRLPALKREWIKTLETHYYGIEQRMHHFLLKKAEDRYNILCAEHPELIKQAPLKYIASMIGIDPRHLSRIRKGREEA